MRTAKFSIVLAGALLSAAAVTSNAGACVNGSNLYTERALSDTYGCWPELFTWAWSAYQMNDSTWQGEGLFDACNVNRPFAKMVNAVYLINYTLSDNYIPQWHSTTDYESESRAANNAYHGPFYLRIIQQAPPPNPHAAATTEAGRFAARDRTNYHCPVFSNDVGTDSVLDRAFAMLHEAWHHWQHKNGFDRLATHAICPETGERVCDHYYFHGSGRFNFGQLYMYAGDAFHSPNQVAVEFIADLAEEHLPDVPKPIVVNAEAFGNLQLRHAFVQPPPWKIGEPRPF